MILFILDAYLALELLDHMMLRVFYHFSQWLWELTCPSAMCRVPLSPHPYWRGDFVFWMFVILAGVKWYLSWFWFLFPLWLVILSMCLHISWPLIVPLSKSVYSGSLSFLLTDCFCCNSCWVFWVSNIFWRSVLSFWINGLEISHILSDVSSCNGIYSFLHRSFWVWYSLIWFQPKNCGLYQCLV